MAYFNFGVSPRFHAKIFLCRWLDYNWETLLSVFLCNVFWFQKQSSQCLLNSWNLNDTLVFLSHFNIEFLYFIKHVFFLIIILYSSIDVAVFRDWSTLIWLTIQLYLHDIGYLKLVNVIYLLFCWRLVKTKILFKNIMATFVI